MHRLACLCLLLALASTRSTADPLLTIAGPETTFRLTAAEFATLPHTDLKAVEPHEKKERLYSGVAMREPLTRVGAPLGDKFRDPALTLEVVVHCQDNYTVLYSLAELDENFSPHTILLADREDGHPPPATAAPFRLVAPGDKRGARWARMVTSLAIVSLPAKP